MENIHCRIKAGSPLLADLVLFIFEALAVSQLLLVFIRLLIEGIKLLECSVEVRGDHAIIQVLPSVHIQHLLLPIPKYGIVASLAHIVIDMDKEIATED